MMPSPLDDPGKPLHEEECGRGGDPLPGVNAGVHQDPRQASSTVYFHKLRKANNIL